MGLKNAGATCYMNSVIQQLYMIPPIRNGILAVEGTGTDVDEETSGDEKQESEVRQETGSRQGGVKQETGDRLGGVRQETG